MDLNKVKVKIAEAHDILEILTDSISDKQLKNAIKAADYKLIYTLEEFSDSSNVTEETEQTPKVIERRRIKDRRKVCIVACYLSKFGHEGIFGEEYNQTKAFEKIAELLSIKKNTLKGTRDIFDPLFDNGRVGWKNRPLKNEEQEIYDLYNKKTQLDYLKEVRVLLGVQEDKQ